MADAGAHAGAFGAGVHGPGAANACAHAEAGAAAGVPGAASAGAHASAFAGGGAAAHAAAGVHGAANAGAHASAYAGVGAAAHAAAGDHGGEAGSANFNGLPPRYFYPGPDTYAALGAFRIHFPQDKVARHSGPARRQVERDAVGWAGFGIR